MFNDFLAEETCLRKSLLGFDEWGDAVEAQLSEYISILGRCLDHTLCLDNVNSP